MSQWKRRRVIDFAELSREERALYNPAFTAVAVTRAVQGYQAQYKRGCPITVAVLSVVMAMQPGIRRLLPATIRNGLTRWLEEHQTIKIAMAQNAEGLAAVVRPGLLLALQVRVLQIDQAGLLEVNPGAITKAITADTEETLAIQKASYMLGRWLPSTGSLGTVMTLLGVRP
ncbi:three component ABC system middle component [Micromonospora tulbaghiae]|uniref:three component ABC system middle component n=1 Tax=Micromonospora tulbaghiae TaxID=479978 RepID=UPI0033E00AAC